MTMQRRPFVGTVGVAWRFAGWAQQGAQIARLGYLTGGVLAARRTYLDAFKAGMRDYGYEEGRNLSLTIRAAEGDFSRLPALARDLLQHQPDVLLVSTTPGVLAAHAATSTVPIVMIGPDPVGLGLVKSLARLGVASSKPPSP